MNVSVSTVSSTMLMMLIIIAIGYIARKAGFMDGEFTEKLSGVTLCVCQPFMIISAIVSIEYSEARLKDGLTVLMLCIFNHALFALLARLMTCKFKKNSLRRISEFAMIFGNCGFYGFPVYRAIFGDTGVFLGSFYVLGFNILGWSYGLYIIKKGNPSAKISVKKMLLNFGTISSLIGIVIFVLRINIPSPVMSAFEAVGDMCTPLSLFIIGSLISTIPFKKLFSNLRVYYVSAMRLVVFPVIASSVLLLFRFAGVSDELIIFGSIAAAMPTASLAAMFAAKYDLEPDFAALTAGLATIASVITIPFVAWFIGFCR